MSTKSRCPYFGSCGGCKYIDSPYSEQLKKKHEFVKKCIGETAAKQKCGIEPVVGAASPLHYRNKVHSVFSRDRRGQIIRGMYREETHDVINVSGCLIEDEEADRIIETVKKLLPSFKIKTYDEDSGYGFLRHVLVRVGHRINADSSGMSSEYMVVLVTADPVFPSKNNFVKALRKEHPQITTVIQNINDKRTSLILGPRSIVMYGKGYIEDDLLGLRFRISASSFFQINPLQTKKLYSLALEMAGLTGKEYVLDAYCGTGTIGMFMAASAKKVLGVELNKDAVKDAVANAKGNKIDNIEFVNADATEYIRRMCVSFTEQGKADSLPLPKIDVLCMDPPRSGSTPEFIKATAALAIGRIVYVSCNPETLAADLKSFIREGYSVKRIVPVDMFPQTPHVETVVLMSKKNS